MSDYYAKDVLVTLTTQSGVTGKGCLSELDDAYEPKITWSTPLPPDSDEGPIVEVKFEVLDRFGNVTATQTGDHEDWRELCAEGTFDMMLDWVKRGLSLDDAFYAAKFNQDPNQRDGDYEEDIERLAAELLESRAMIRQLVEALETTGSNGIKAHQQRREALEAGNAMWRRLTPAEDREDAFTLARQLGFDTPEGMTFEELVQAQGNALLELLPAWRLNGGKAP